MATGQLILNIALDMAQVASGVPKVIGLLESMNIKVKQTASTMKVVEQSTKGMFTEMTKGWVGMAAKLNTLDYTLRIVQNAFMNTFGQAGKAIEDYKLGIASASAVVLQFMELKPGESISDGFQRAKKYVEDIYPVLEKVAAKTLLSGQETQLLFNEIVQGGIMLDATNRKAVEGFEALGNAIKITTRDQGDSNRQIITETKALMNGVAANGAQLIRMLKNTDEYFERNWKNARKTGTELEYLGGALKGFVQASSLVEQTWTAIGSALKTTANIVLRGVFTKDFESIMGMLTKLNDYLYENQQMIKEKVHRAWVTFKEVMIDTYNVISTVIKFIQEWKDEIIALVSVLVSLKIIGNVVSMLLKLQMVLAPLIPLLQGTTTATVALGTAFKTILTPTNMLALAIGGLVLAHQKLQEIQNSTRNKIDEFKFNMDVAPIEDLNSWQQGLTYAINELQRQREDLGAELEKQFGGKEAKKLFDKFALDSSASVAIGEIQTKYKKVVGTLAELEAKLNIVNEAMAKMKKTSEVPTARTKQDQKAIEDMQKLANEYDALIAKFEEDIALSGLEGWQKELGKIAIEYDKWVKKWGKEKADKALQFAIEWIGKEKMIQDLKEAEQKAKETQKALDDIRKNWDTVTQSAMGYEKSLIDLDVATGKISEAEGLQKHIDQLQKAVDYQELYIADIEEAGDRGSAEWNKQSTALTNYLINIEQLKTKLQELNNSKTFAEGLDVGIDEYVKSLEFGFERGKDMAREAAESMQSFFEDVFVGRIKVTWKDLMGWMGGLFAQLVAEMTTKLVAMTGIVQKLGGSLAGVMGGSTQSLLGGAGLGAVAGGLFGGGDIGSLAGGAAGGLLAGTTFGTTALLGGMESVLGSSIMGALGTSLNMIIPVIGGIIGAGLGKLIGDLVSNKPHTPNLQLGSMGTPNQEWISKFGEGDFALRQWDEIGRKNTDTVLKVFDALKTSMKSFMTEMGMDLSKLDETWKSTMANADSNLQKVINRWVGEYASFLTGIDFKQFQKSGEEMADTVSRVISAIAGMKMLGENIDLVIQYVENSTDSFRQFRIAMNELDKKIQDTKNNMTGLTDPSEIFDAANELYTLTMQRYEAEIQFVQELQQAIQDLQIEFAQFTSSMIKKIADLGGNTGGFDDAIKMIADAGRGLAQQLMNPDISLGEKLPMLKNFLSFLDEWYQLNLDKIQVVGEAEIAIYEDRIESLNKEKDIINDQIDALQTQLRLVEDWQDVLDKTKDMIFDLKATTASPRDVFERLNYVKGEIERVQGLFRGSSGESQIDYTRQLQALISSYGQIGQEAFQRPSMEYQAVYNDMLTWLQEIEAVASVGAKSTEDLLGEIEKLQGRSNDIEREIADWQNKIYMVEERMEGAIQDLNREAQGYYKWAMEAGNTIYAGKLDNLQTTLANVLGPDGTVAQYIERQRADMVMELEGVKQYPKGILYGLTGYNALAVPSYQHGTSYVPQTGLAYLHKGETVIPANGGINLTLAPTIYAGGDANPREIWRELEDYAIQSVKGGRLGKALKER